MDFKKIVRDQLPPLVIAREPEIVDELALHLADLYAEGRAAGLEHEVALQKAKTALPARAEEFARDLESATRALPSLIVDRWRAQDDGLPLSDGSSKWAMLADLRRDIRYALRTLARTPGFTAVACITLALGIGANAVIFSAVDAVLLRGAPVADADSAVTVYTTSADGRDRFSTSSYPDYLDLKASGTFADLAVFASIPLVLDSGGVNEPIPGELVSGNYFDVLGVRMPLGRAFSPDEDRPGSQQRVVVMSHEIWMNRFGSDRAIVGRAITLNGHSYTVIGVTPRGFTGPILGRSAEMWAPAALQPELRPPSAGLRRAFGDANLLGRRGPRWLNMVGRLKPGATLEGAASAAAVVSARLEREHPQSNQGRQFTVVKLGDGPGIRTSTRPMLRLLAAAVALVLLIACANVASLLLVRAVSRRREVAVRMAVGAGRGRLMRQWLTESLLLALAGALLGVLIAIWGVPLLHQFGIPESVPLRVDDRVLLFVFVAAVSSGLVFGMAPVAHTLRRDTIAAIRDEGGSIASGVSSTRLRSAFVVVQVALSVVLLVGAGLFLKTLKNATSVDLGYDVERVLVADINLDVRGYSQQAGQGVYTQILERIRALPGVEAVGAARVTVLSGGARTISVSSNGLPVAPDGSNGMDVRANVITDGYLPAMGIRVSRGRNFLPSDTPGAPRVAILSESLASRLYPNADPVGRVVVLGDDPVQIAGVVPDTVYRSSIERNALPFLYVPLAQNYESGVSLHVRTSGKPVDLIAPVRHAVRQVDPNLVVLRPRPLSGVFAASVGDQRMMATMIGLFGAVALVLAAVGLYGVMAHMAGQRVNEIGIRMALGARPSSILRLVLSEGLRLVGSGSVIGLAGAFAGVRFVENQLYGVTPTDPSTFVSVCIVLLVVGALACLIPARRAMQTDPSVALRT